MHGTPLSLRGFLVHLNREVRIKGSLTEESIDFELGVNQNRPEPCLHNPATNSTS